MRSFILQDNQLKDFMNKLLNESVFDEFQLRNIIVTSFVMFEINSALTEMGKNEEGEVILKENHMLWKDIRPIVKGFIAGKSQPSMIKIIFSISDEARERKFPEADAVFLNLLFKEKKLTAVTGYNPKGFQLDKSGQRAWEQSIINFFGKNSLNFSEDI